MASTREVTPPESIIVNGLSTPPLTNAKRVARILQVFKDCYAGRYPEPSWIVYPLSSAEYDQVLDQLDRNEGLGGFVGHKLRFDFHPIRGELILRMESAKHCTFAKEIEHEIMKSLKYLAKMEIETRPFINKIKSPGGAIYLKEDGKKLRHVPDIRFHHKDAAWPGVIIEVSYSQKQKSLIDLAEDYLLTSDGGIRVMIGIDVEYKKVKEASISIWRLKISPGHDGQPEGEVIQELDNELFRDAEGNPILSSSGLELPLNNFAIQALSNGLPDCSIRVSPETLCTLLAEAEEWDDRSTQLQGMEPVQIKRKHREQTPPEQLTLSDEERVMEEERRIQRRLEEQDLTYSPEGAEDGSQ